MTNTTLSTMKRRTVCSTLATLALSAMILTAPAASAKDGKDGDATRSRVGLAGPAISGQTPYGHAELRTDAERGRSRFNVEAQDVNLAAGTMLDVVIDRAGTRTKVGTIKLGALRSGELELNSQDGDSVPAVQKGDIAIVMNGGVAILIGVF